MTAPRPRGRAKPEAPADRERATDAESAAREREVQAAHLARALTALEHMERIITKTGGYMAPGDQAALFEARAVLAEHGKRPTGSHAPWVDRVPAVVVEK